MNTYSTTEWRTTAARYLRRHPHCACGCDGPATDVDHIVPRRMLVATGVHHPDHPRWLQALTHSCHSRKTQTVDVLLLRRWEAGEDVTQLAEEAMRAAAGVG